MGVLSVCDLHMCTRCMQCLKRSEEGVGSSGTGVRDSYSHICVLEQNPGPLEELPMFLTTEPFLPKEYCNTLLLDPTIQSPICFT